MDNSFDFGALLRKNTTNENKHKGKPAQFVSVAGGVQKRLQTNLKNRKSSRLSIFDKIRDLPECKCPDPISETQSKGEHRRQQLEKWKAEKEQKKKEAAANKKKPFVAGVPHSSLKYVPPPPVPKQGSSGRVTRSQTAKNNTSKRETSPKHKQSFAPRNASFKPPDFKNLTKLPALKPPSKTQKKVNNAITFEPDLPNIGKQTRSKTMLKRQNAINTNTREPVENLSNLMVKGKVSKKAAANTSRVTKTIQSSSSNSSAKSTSSIIKRNKMPVLEKSTSSSSGIEPKTHVIKRIKTPGPRNLTKKSKILTVKPLGLTSSDEQSSSEISATKRTRKSLSSKSSVSLSSNSSKVSSIEPSSAEERPIIVTKNKKPVPASFSSPIIILDSLENSKNESYKTPEKSKHIPKSESSSEEKLRSPRSPVDLPLTPEQIETAKKISPCVTLSRGKENARKEMKWKINEGMLDDVTSDIESVEHFRRQLNSEIKRITEMCDSWDKVSENTVLPDAGQAAIRGAVGQARLLMTQKMQQFASLVERCAHPDHTSVLVTPTDLHGFWDMVFIQVEDVDMKFKKLEELRSRNWFEEKPVEVKRKVIKPAAAKRAKPIANSRIKDMIAAARKAKKDQESSTSNSSPTSTTSSNISAAADSTKTFDAGFFSVRSPVKTPVACTPSTPGGRSLLKAVLSSEANKASVSRNSASFAMLRASVLAKNMETYEGIAPLQLTPQMPPINMNATPGRSILKSANVTSSKSAKKSMKLVFFDDCDSSFEKADKEPAVSTSLIVEDDLHTDSGLSSMDTDKNKADKENISRKLVRQDAVEDVVITRTRRKTKKGETPEEKTPKKATRKKSQGETNTLNAGVTPRRTRKTKSDTETPKRSSRKKALKEVENNGIKETEAVPKRSNRRKRSAPDYLMM